jgi:peptide/nickel transport system substrate-binding protein
MKLRVLTRTIAIVAVVGLVGAACSKKTPTVTNSSSGPVATTSAPVETTAPPQGGSVVFGAEQWPDCVNPITSCAAASWTYYSVLEYVLPRAMQLDLQGNFVNSPMITEAPTLDNGGLVQSPFTITYNIAPTAVWADGTPITSADFDFTNKAILNTTGTYTTIGYNLISAIDTTDPAKAVISFTTPFVDWPDLFGGAFGGLIEKAAFPKENTSDKPDLKDEMATDIPFSGGPFILKSWSPDQAVLVRNDKYFGTVANFDQVTMVPRIDQDTEIQSLLTGEVAAIYPQPSDSSLLDRVAGNPAVKAIGGNGTYYEALWFNHSKAPLDDPKVREALMYAIDRQSVIDTIIKLNNPDAVVLNCGFDAFPGLGPWCGQTPLPFEQFTYDPTKARELLTADGYDCTDTSAACTKNGADLVVEYSTVSTNTRRTTTQELLKEAATPAGFTLTVKNYDAGTLFGDCGPHGCFTMADYAQSVAVDPSVTASFTCDAIPTKENSFAGGNWNHWCDTNADALMKASDGELDPAKRLDDFNQLYALQAADFLSLPLYILPSVSAWRTDQIAGPIGDYSTHIYGLFFNMNEWYVASA